MLKRSIFQVDSFTISPFTGNPAGVVHPSDGLRDEQMLQISNELGNSETAFIESLKEKATQQIRFFTPKQEVPLCTHATVASYHILATVFALQSGVYQMQCKAGLLPIGIEQRGNHPLIRVTQKEGHFGSVLSEGHIGKLCEALHIDATLLYEDFPVQIVSTGNAKVLVGIRSKMHLDRLHIRRDSLIQLGMELGVPGFYVYTFDQAVDGITAYTRMFSPGSGVDEDPVTGNAAGALALYLNRYSERLIEQRATFSQGEAMGRQGLVSVEVNQLFSTVLGQACTVFETHLDM